MDKQDIQELIEHENQIRIKYKRCKTCRFLQFRRKISYLLTDEIDYVYRCLYTNKIFNTSNIEFWFTGWGKKGRFCKNYKPKLVTEDYFIRR